MILKISNNLMIFLYIVNINKVISGYIVRYWNKMSSDYLNTFKLKLKINLMTTAVFKSKTLSRFFDIK